MGIQAAKWNDNEPFFQLAFDAKNASGGYNNSIAGWKFDTQKLKKEHGSDPYKMEIDTDAIIKQDTPLTGVQALTMWSGSDADWDSSTVSASLVQISNIEQFIDEEQSYTQDRDKITILYDELTTAYAETSKAFSGGE